jgi:hypothetical protein
MAWRDLQLDIVDEFEGLQPVIAWPAKLRYRDQREYMRVYYATHKHVWREYFEANRERIYARKRARYWAHRDEMLRKRRAYCQRNRLAIIAADRRRRNARKGGRT